MRNLKATLLALILLITGGRALAQTGDYLSKVKVYVSPHSQERLQAINILQLDHFRDKPGFIEAEIGQEEMRVLRQSGLRYEILVENTIAEVNNLNRAFNEQRRLGLVNDDGSAKGDFAGRSPFEQPGSTIANIINTPTGFKVYNENFGYYSLPRMDSIIGALYNAYSPSNLVDTFHIGTTVGGNIIKVIKISDNAGTDEANEPECYFQGLQHAREAIGGSSMIFYALYLLENYASDIRIKNLVDNREIYIVFCMNPDGWNYNLTSSGLAANAGGVWRKNRKPNTSPYSGTGVDLNRNWSTGWGNCPTMPSSCGSNVGTDDTFIGPSAFSENETQAVRNFIKSKHIVIANDQHSYGPYFSIPFGRPALHTATYGGDANLEDDQMSAAEANWYLSIPALMGKYNGMRAGNSFQALGYEVAGGIKDWMFRGEIGTGISGGQKSSIKGMTGEGGLRIQGPGASTVKNFWPASSQIVTLCKGMTYQNLQMTYSAGSYVDLQDMTSIDLASKAGNFTFRIKRIGLDNQPVTVSVVPIMNTGTVGSPVIVNSLPNYYDTYTGNINYNLPAAITAGQIVKFAWKVETTGYSYSDTITKFFQPTVLLTDNMDGTLTTNWTNEVEPLNSASGFASPFNYTYNTTGDWRFTSGGMSGNALSDSTNGSKYSERTLKRIRYKNTFNLTGATAAYLSFYTKHALDNFKDKVQVQVSTNGSTWTAINGKTTVKEPGTPDVADESTLNGIPALTGIQPDWVKEEFNLATYLGQPTVYFRFEFTSDPTESFWAAEDEGIFIDSLKVISTNTALQTLAANFLAFTGKLQNDNTIELKWEASTDRDHAYFEVEKSGDRISFNSIGRVTGNSNPYTLIDPSPFVGNNFYRIKAVDNAGKAEYSNVINVLYNPSLHFLQTYPNPAVDILNIRLKMAATEKIKLQVADLSGRIISSKEVIADTNLKTYQVNTETLVSNMYILKITNSKGEIIGIQKFVKQ
jgi:carboxypeptidase T